MEIGWCIISADDEPLVQPATFEDVASIAAGTASAILRERDRRDRRGSVLRTTAICLIVSCAFILQMWQFQRQTAFQRDQDSRTAAYANQIAKRDAEYRACTEWRRSRALAATGAWQDALGNGELGLDNHTVTPEQYHEIRKNAYLTLKRAKKELDKIKC